MPTATMTSAFANLIPLQDRPAYREAAERVARIRARREAVDRELAQLREVRAEEPVTGGLMGRARALLAGDRPAPRGAAVTERIEELHAELDDLERARRLGEGELQAVRVQVSIEAATEVLPAYLEHAARMADVLAELSRLAAAEHAMRRMVTAAGFDDRLPRLSLQQARLDVPSVARVWAERARQAGVAVDG
jgi:hypothetical protein